MLLKEIFVPDAGFASWLHSLLSRSSNNQLLLIIIVWTAWFIWGGHNDYIFRQREQEPHIIANCGLNAGYESFISFHSIQQRELVVPSQSVPLHWTAPQVGSLSCNIDAAFDRGKHEAGLGILLRDNAGKILHVQAQKVKADSVAVAELLALRKAMCIIHAHFPLIPVEVRTDAVNSVTWIKSSSEADPWFARAILTDIRVMLQRNRNISVKYVKRNANCAADFLAKEALHLRDNCRMYALNVVKLQLLCNNDVSRLHY